MKSKIKDQPLPKFEIVIDEDEGISEVYYDKTPLSGVLPTIVEVRPILKCNGSNYVDLRLLGDFTVRQKHE